MNRKGTKDDPVALSTLPSLPVGWTWCIASDICKVIASGSTPVSDKMYTGKGDIPFIKVYNLTHNGKLDFSIKPTFVDRDTHLGLLSRSRVVPGDVLINIVGPPLGKVSLVPPDYQEWNINQAIVLFRSDEGISHRYLAFALMTKPIMDRITSRAKATAGQYNIGVGMCRSLLPLPVAPSCEQVRIVERIEELFSDLDAGVAALERAKANLKRYRASVLKAAVDGSLTAEWREKHPAAEPAQKLLARILKERRRKWEEVQLAKFKAAGKQPPKNWKSKYKEPTPPDTTNLPDLPEGWCWASVEQIGDVQLGRQRSPKNRSRNYPTKYVRAANLTENGLDLSDVLDMDFLPSAIDRYRLAEGDILLSEASGSPDQVGKPVVWNNEIEECCFQNTVIRLRPAQMSHQFLLAVFQHFYFNKVFAGIAAGVGINHLSAAKFSRITIPLPPFEEQEVIGIEVAERLSQIQAADIAIGHGLKRAARLRQSILKQAFEGKLVAQDPADEPASALLTRIQETRPARTTKGKAKAAKSPKKKESKGPFFRQAAVVSYAVRRLAPCKSFGRTQLEKTLHLAQSHLGINLEFEFVRHAAGPFDKAIYAIEGAAKKNDWFSTQDRKTFGVRYQPGAKIDAMCQYAEKYLDTNRAAFDQLLEHISKMNTDQAELFATIYAAWNDLLLDGRTASDDAIVKEVHGWHEKKKRFDRAKITKCLAWMREHDYVPTGQGQRTLLAEKRQSPSSKK